MASSVGGRKHGEHCFAIAFQLRGADPLNLAKFGQIARLALGDLPQSGVMENVIRRDPSFGRDP